MMRARVALAALALVGCYRSAREAELIARIERLEARVAAQEAAAAAPRRSNEIELALLAHEIETLVGKLDEKLEAIEPATRAQSTTPPPIRRRTPDPAVTYAVPLGGSPALGSPRAKVTVVIAYEFACRFCRKAWDTLDQLRKKYGADLRVVYKQYVVHRGTATAAAHASCAAHRQGKWREMADLLWIKAFDARQFDQAHIDALAVEVGLDMQRYQADIAGPCPQELQADQAMFHKVAVSGTPTFYINGRHLVGAKPIAVFEQLIDEELKKATALVKSGVKPERLYEQEIVGKGVAEVPMP